MCSLSALVLDDSIVSSLRLAVVLLELALVLHPEVAGLFLFPIVCLFLVGFSHLYPFGFCLLSFSASSFRVLFDDLSRRGTCRRLASALGLSCFVGVCFSSAGGVIMICIGLFVVCFSCLSVSGRPCPCCGVCVLILSGCGSAVVGAGC